MSDDRFPWIRQVEVRIGPIPEWQVTYPLPPEPRAVVIKGDGSAELPRIRFNVNKHAAGIPTPATVEIYNLSPELRSALRVHGVWITLSAGWKNMGMSKLFSGSVQSAWSRREGANIITSLVCLTAFDTQAEMICDPGEFDFYANPGTTLKEVVINIVSLFQGVKADEKLIQLGDKTIGPRGWIAHGRGVDCLNELSRVYGFSWGVIDGVFQVTLDQYPLQDSLPRLSTENGFLLRVEPILTSAFSVASGAVIDSLLNPLILPARLVKVDGALNSDLDGYYYAMVVTHLGDTHSNQWTTTVETTFFDRSIGIGPQILQ